MNEPDLITPPTTSTNCDSNFSSGSVTLILDAPLAPLTSTPYPNHFRTMGSSASGSAQFSLSEMIWLVNNKKVGSPLVLVDLRQESHGFFNLGQKPLNNEQWIAVSWFAERDWANVGKGLPSITDDEYNRLHAAFNTNASVCQILSKTKEDGICTATTFPVQVDGVAEESDLTSWSYLRLPTTDHCRPEDSIVDQFVAFEASLDPKTNTWLHFHCHGGDGRTTTFMAMHDIINNPTTPLTTIVARQKSIGGVELNSFPDPTSFKYPFAVDRWTFIQNFYTYVGIYQSGGFTTTWSEWVSKTLPATAESAASA